MGINGTTCFLNNIKAPGGSPSVIDFACHLFASWPNVEGRIIHHDVFVRRYMARLIVTLLECDNGLFCTIHHEADATIIIPRRTKAEIYASARPVIDLLLAENARSLILMMEELDQTRDLKLCMALMGTFLFLDQS